MPEVGRRTGAIDRMSMLQSSCRAPVTGVIFVRAAPPRPAGPSQEMRSVDLAQSFVILIWLVQHARHKSKEM
jgi:hypothetical protein